MALSCSASMVYLYKFVVRANRCVACWLRHNLEVSLHRDWRCRSFLVYPTGMSRHSLRGSLRFIPHNEFLKADQLGF